ncbi:hypothetical protein [Pedobacter arcticus]|uniref:hypothetical protein n=1 Tax=Pedobacter arcticus TaxID=752140 RepID=UPI000301BC36|nr:hypothetical protein [Pedobacter arcticus]
MKIDLKAIEIKDLNGVVYKVDDLPKQIGNLIFTNASTIEVSDIARKLHAGKPAEVSNDELEQITAIVEQHPYYKPFAHVQILAYLKEKLTIESVKS